MQKSVSFFVYYLYIMLYNFVINVWVHYIASAGHALWRVSWPRGRSSLSPLTISWTLLTQEMYRIALTY